MVATHAPPRNARPLLLLIIITTIIVNPPHKNTLTTPSTQLLLNNNKRLLITYSEALAHQIYAAADFVLVPSMFGAPPCARLAGAPSCCAARPVLAAPFFFPAMPGAPGPAETRGAQTQNTRTRTHTQINSTPHNHGATTTNTEPCGLTQMIGMRYGAVPVVRRTGGLADTVWNFDEKTRKGTGFVFEHFDDAGLSWALRRALDVWGHGTGQPRARWKTIQRNGMGLPLGWKHRVGRYVELYEKLAAS